MTGSAPGGSTRAASAVPLLLRHDLRRWGAAVTRPRAGVWLAVLIPAAGAVAALWLAGEQARPDVRDTPGATLLGLLLGGAVGYAAYGVLFRPADDSFLRRLGLPAEGLFVQRAIRLLAVTLIAVALLMVPWLREGLPARPLSIALGSGLAAWGTALLAHARAARSVALPGARPGLLSRSLGWDRELMAVGPLVFAPLVPVVAGMVAGGVVAGGRGGWTAVAVVAALSLAAAAAAVRPFAAALPRLAPRALEMAHDPASDVAVSDLVVGRGVARLLPGRVAAAWARDAVVGSRRYPWTARLVWPVAIVSVIALARWGEDPGVRGWVAAAVTLALLAQGAALVSLGRLERGGLRWIDRSAGVGRTVRWLGRWAWGAGMGLWLTAPVAIAWGIAVGPAWGWVAGGVLVSGVAAGSSILAAGG